MRSRGLVQTLKGSPQWDAKLRVDAIPIDPAELLQDLKECCKNRFVVIIVFRLSGFSVPSSCHCIRKHLIPFFTTGNMAAITVPILSHTTKPFPCALLLLTTLGSA